MALISLQPTGQLRFRILLGLGVSGVFWRWLFSSALGADVTSKLHMGAQCLGSSQGNEFPSILGTGFLCFKVIVSLYLASN